jgi:hypothetical protein
MSHSHSDTQPCHNFLGALRAENNSVKGLSARPIQSLDCPLPVSENAGYSDVLASGLVTPSRSTLEYLSLQRIAA